MADTARAVLRANQEHYSEPGAFLYVEDKYHSRRMQVATELLRKYLDPGLERIVILDIGPGDTSPVGEAIYPSSVRIAIDASPGALANAHGFTTRICADVTGCLPLDDGSIDAIFCGELIEHLFDPRSFLAELHARRYPLVS